MVLPLVSRAESPLSALTLDQVVDLLGELPKPTPEWERFEMAVAFGAWRVRVLSPSTPSGEVLVRLPDGRVALLRAGDLSRPVE